MAARTKSNGGQFSDISIYDQDKRAQRQHPFSLATQARRVRLLLRQPKQCNPTTRRLAVMNLTFRGIKTDLNSENADTFRRDLHPKLRAVYVLANGSMSSNQFGKRNFDSAS